MGCVFAKWPSQNNFGSTEKRLISHKATKAQRKISGFRPEKSGETPSVLLFSPPPLLIPAFFQESQLSFFINSWGLQGG